MLRNKLVVGVLLFMVVCIGVITSIEISKYREEQQARQKIERQIQQEKVNMEKVIQQDPFKNARTGKW